MKNAGKSVSHPLVIMLLSKEKQSINLFYASKYYLYFVFASHDVK